MTVECIKDKDLPFSISQLLHKTPSTDNVPTFSNIRNNVIELNSELFKPSVRDNMISDSKTDLDNIKLNGIEVKNNDVLGQRKETILPGFPRGAQMPGLQPFPSPDLSLFDNLMAVHSGCLSWPMLLSNAGAGFFLKSDSDFGKHRKRRTTFSRKQLTQMEVMFQSHPYLSPCQRASLAEDLELTPAQVQVWFQNRRAKCKKLEQQQESGT